MTSILTRFSRAFAALALVAGLLASTVPAAAFAQSDEESAPEVITGLETTPAVEKPAAEPAAPATEEPVAKTEAAPVTEAAKSTDQADELGLDAVGDAVEITTVAELRSAIENQADDQTWNIAAGDYGMDRFDDITVEGQTGWYFPITANNLTIQGEGNPVIYGNEFSYNGNWSSQNLVSVFGDNVTISGVTLMPKVEGNKTIEVLGADVTIEDVVIEPNTKVDDSVYANMTNAEDRAFSEEWGGSIYFSNAGNHVVSDVTIHNGGISFRYSPAGTNITFENASIVNKTDDDFINGYRYSSGFNNTSGSSITGAPEVRYEVDAATDNLDSAIVGAKDGDTINLMTDYTSSDAVILSKAVVLEGNGNSLTFTNGGTNGSSATLGFGVTASATVNDLVVTTTTLADNLVEVAGAGITAAFNNVSISGSLKAGMTVLDGSAVFSGNTVLSSNTWGGVEVKNIDGAHVHFTSSANLDYSVSDNAAFANAPAGWVDADVLENADSFVNDDAEVLENPVLEGTQTWWNIAEDSNGGGNGGGGSRGGSSNSSNNDDDSDTSGTVDGGTTGGGQVLGASTYNFTVDLTIGSTGADVNALQQMLIDAGLLMIPAPTGYFGEMTRAALAKWQAAHGVTPSVGYFGPLTRAAVAASSTPAPTMTATERAALIKDLMDKVKELQEKLDEMNDSDA